MKSLYKVALVAVAIAMCVTTSQASSLASDNAGNYATWNTGDNLGSGFGAWTINDGTGGGGGGHWLGSSTGNAGGSSGGIDTLGKSWGLWAKTDVTGATEAIRPFTGALSIGQVFLIDMDNGWVAGGGVVGLGLQNSSSQNRIEFFFAGGGSEYTLQGSSGIGTGIGWTGDGLKLEFTLTGADTMDVIVKNTGGSTLGTFNSVALGGDTGSGIDRVRLFNWRGGDDGNYDIFYNNMAIIPEPSSIVLVSLGLLGALIIRRRKS